MGGALHSLAWAGPLHPSPNCQLSAEMHADQLSYAGRGEVNSTCNRLFCKTALEISPTDAAPIHVHVLNRDKRLTSGLMLVFDLPGLSRSSTISLMACSIRSWREEEGGRRERGRPEREGKEGGRKRGEGEWRERGRRPERGGRRGEEEGGERGKGVTGEGGRSERREETRERGGRRPERERREEEAGVRGGRRPE